MSNASRPHFSNTSIFEPWRIRWINAGEIEIVDHNDNPVGYKAPAVYRSYAERIVACVNVCEHRSLEKMTAEVDELRNS